MDRRILVPSDGSEQSVDALAYALASFPDDGVDQIVLGSHGRDGATRLLLGSVAETVVRHAPVPGLCHCWEVVAGACVATPSLTCPDSWVPRISYPVIGPRLRS